MVPLPETEYVQLNCVESPECRTSGVKGVALPAAAAVPVVTATGVPTLCRVMSAPPGLLAVSFTVTCCRPADICKGAADAAIESCPGNCAWTPGLVTVPVDSAWVASLPSVPCANDRSTTCPAEVAEVVQMKDAVSPARSTGTGSALTAPTVPRPAVEDASAIGAAAVTPCASASPVFFTASAT